MPSLPGGGLCGGCVGVSCLGGNTTLCKHRSDLTVDIIYTPIKICEVYGVYLRVYEVLSVSFGLANRSTDQQTNKLFTRSIVLPWKVTVH